MLPGCLLYKNDNLSSRIKFKIGSYPCAVIVMDYFPIAKHNHNIKSLHTCICVKMLRHSDILFQLKPTSRLLSLLNAACLNVESTNTTFIILIFEYLSTNMITIALNNSICLIFDNYRSFCVIL